MSEYMLISADSHVTMPAERWVDYLDPEFRDRAPRVERTEEGDFMVFEGVRTPQGGFLSNMAGRKPQDYTPNVRRLEEARPGAWDPAERIKDQDIDGVSAEILYFGGPLRQAKDPGVRVNSYRGYNRWLADFSSYAPKRLLGMAAIPLDSPEIAVAEVAAAARLGLRGALIDLFPPEGSFADPEWAPLWTALIDHNFPACLHVGGQRGSGLRPGPQFMTGLVVSKLQMAEAVAELIYGQVLENYPDLRIVSVEAQIGWISFVHYYMDHLFDRHRYWTGSTLREHPSFYWKRQVYATFMEDPAGLRERNHIGIDNIMWSNDYPHSETTWPNSKSLTDEWFTDYGDEDKAKILWRNAARVHGVEV
jgi:predicted TIM-barrel fold metal-dependent hydrolase